jgi:mRNA interferase RelE/StbE
LAWITVTYEIIWDEPALNSAARFLKDDPDGLRQVMDAIDLLAVDARPSGSAPYGSPDLRRIHVSRYRVMYEISEATVTIIVIHLGRHA